MEIEGEIIFQCTLLYLIKKRYIIVVNEKLNNESKDFLRY